MRKRTKYIMLKSLNDEMSKGLPAGCGTVGIVGMLLIMLTVMLSCKQKEVVVEVPVEVPTYVHDTLKVVQKETETVHVTDSMWLKGDTVFKYRDRWREYTIHDTLHHVVRDSVGYPVYINKTVTKEVKKPLSWLQKTLMGIGGVALLGIALFFGFKYLKKKL